MRTFIGDYRAEGLRFAVVATRWNPDVVEKLITGAVRTLVDCGAYEENIDLIYVPGAYEIPLVLQNIAQTERYDGIIALGAVIRGETAHFDFVAGDCSRALMNTMLQYNLPMGFGVLTCDTMAQCMARAGDNEADNKGSETAYAVIDMISVLDKVVKNRGHQG